MSKPYENPAYKYGERAGSAGNRQDPTRCVKAVWGGRHSMFESQCTRKRVVGLYCKQHSASQEGSK